MIVATRVESDRSDRLFSDNAQYALLIEPIPESERISPELGYHLIHQETKLLCHADYNQ